jgi:hypothetical protein
MANRHIKIAATFARGVMVAAALSGALLPQAAYATDPIQQRIQEENRGSAMQDMTDREARGRGNDGVGSALAVGLAIAVGAWLLSSSNSKSKPAESAPKPRAATETAPSSGAVTFRVVGVPNGYNLLMFDGPHSSHNKVARLANDASGIVLKRCSTSVDDTTWCEAQFGSNVGWVSASNLARN